MKIPEQAGREADFEDILLQIIQEKLSQKKLDGFRFQDSILPVFLDVLEFSDSIIKDIEENGQGQTCACQSGCTYCCHSRVKIIPIEALLISTFIQTDFTETQINELNTGISRTLSMTKDKTSEQVYALKNDLPCLFLKKGKCSIYKIRPSICRSWNSFDSMACKSAYDSADSKSSVSVSPARNFVFGTTRGLFEQISKASELQSDTLLLHNAVSDCLSIPDPMGQWSRGYDVFRYE